MCGTVLLVCLLCDHQVTAGKSPRIRFTINDNWKFLPADVEESDSARYADPDGWEKVQLPHTWNAMDVLDDEPGYRRGRGTYRRQLKLDRSFRDKRIFIFFEGANQVTTVSVNGKYVGKHVGGYTAFSFDITDFVHTRDSNLIEVSIDNSLDKNIPPINGDFNMYGGIYRDVWIIATDLVHIDVTDLASPGVEIRTPKVSADAATFDIAGTIVNSSARTRNIEVLNTVVDPTGRTVAGLKSNVGLGPNSNARFQASGEISKPSLWSPDDPKLYSVRTVIRENGRIFGGSGLTLTTDFFSTGAT
jgi:beta-galactosidase